MTWALRLSYATVASYVSTFDTSVCHGLPVHHEADRVPSEAGIGARLAPRRIPYIGLARVGRPRGRDESQQDQGAEGASGPVPVLCARPRRAANDPRSAAHAQA